jgi:hypothetical protein
MSSQTDRRRPVTVVVLLALLVLGLVVAMTVSRLGVLENGVLGNGSRSVGTTYVGSDLLEAKTPASTTPTTLTVNQWKQRYQRVVTRLADDGLAVVKDGAKESGVDPSKLAAQAKRTVAACNTWRHDSESASSEAPAIPLPAAQASWRQLVVASGRAASDCSRVLTTRNPSAAKDFRTELATVYGAEGRLATELNGAG